MGTKAAAKTQISSEPISKLLERYGAGPVRFSGASDGLYWVICEN